MNDDAVKPFHHPPTLGSSEGRWADRIIDLTDACRWLYSTRCHRVKRSDRLQASSVSYQLPLRWLVPELTDKR